MRKALDASIDNYTTRILSYEEWATVLAEITYVINSRPLFPNGDPGEFQCITRNDLLHPYGQSTVPQPVPDDVNPRDMMGIVQQRVEVFWNSWIKHMPPQLNTRNK